MDCQRGESAAKMPEKPAVIGFPGKEGKPGCEKITGEMLPPDASVTELKNVGPKRAALYQKLGIETVSDLLTFYPRSYQDFTSPKMAAECRDGEPAVIEGKILRKLPPAYIRKGMVLYKLTVHRRDAELHRHHLQQ